MFIVKPAMAPISRQRRVGCPSIAIDHRRQRDQGAGPDVGPREPQEVRGRRWPARAGTQPAGSPTDGESGDRARRSAGHLAIGADTWSARPRRYCVRLMTWKPKSLSTMPDVLSDLESERGVDEGLNHHLAVEHTRGRRRVGPEPGSSEYSLGEGSEIVAPACAFLSASSARFLACSLVRVISASARAPLVSDQEVTRPDALFGREPPRRRRLGTTVGAGLGLHRRRAWAAPRERPVALGRRRSETSSRQRERTTEGQRTRRERNYERRAMGRANLRPSAP